MASPSSANLRTTAVRAAVLAGIVGNVTISLYLSLALPVFFATPPLLLFQWDASNIVGAWAFHHGLGSAALGLFFDFIVAGCWAAVFVALYLALPAVRRSAIVSGLFFGFVVMLVMFYVIVPLGHAQHPSPNPRPLFNALVAHTVFFGLPIALVVRKTLALSS
jgi:hypothetical protein